MNIDSATEFYLKGDDFTAELIAIARETGERFLVGSVNAHALTRDSAKYFLTESLEMLKNSPSTKEAFPEHIYYTMIKIYL